MNAYGMRYSFVWDHWVYLSALGIIALVAALVVRVAERLRMPAVVYGFAAIVLPAFGPPDLAAGRDVHGHGNPLADDAGQESGLLDGPQQSGSFCLSNEGRIEEAMEHYRKAIQINPNNFEAQLNNLGIALAAKGRLDEAIENYRKAIQINPNYFEALNNLGIALAAKGRWDEAIENYHQAIQINPNFPEALNNLGNALAAKGRFDEAIENYRKAIQINPNYAEALNNLGNALAAQGRFEEAIENYRKAIQIDPNYAEALNNLAWMLAASPDDELRNGAEAVRLAERACELTHYGQPAVHRDAGRRLCRKRPFPGSGGHGGKGGTTCSRCRADGRGGEKPAIARTLPGRQTLS